MDFVDKITDFMIYYVTVPVPAIDIIFPYTCVKRIPIPLLLPTYNISFIHV